MQQAESVRRFEARTSETCAPRAFRYARQAPDQRQRNQVVGTLVHASLIQPMEEIIPEGDKLSQDYGVIMQVKIAVDRAAEMLADKFRIREKMRDL